MELIPKKRVLEEDFFTLKIQKKNKGEKRYCFSYGKFC